VINVLGLDLSITGTGVAHTLEGAACTHTIKPKGKGDKRLLEIRRTIRELAPGAALALIEAPTARSASSVISGMVHGVVRAELLELGVPYGTLMPSSLKKYATGKGTGDKVPMALEAYKRAGLTFADDNQCDAWWLWVAALGHLDQAPFQLPALNRESLKKIRMEG
jgi:Holliday junction resolvasome RuvABC endonuclease subunit